MTLVGASTISNPGDSDRTGARDWDAPSPRTLRGKGGGGGGGEAEEDESDERLDNEFFSCEDTCGGDNGGEVETDGTRTTVVRRFRGKGIRMKQPDDFFAGGFGDVEFLTDVAVDVEGFMIVGDEAGYVI